MNMKQMMRKYVYVMKGGKGLLFTKAEAKRANKRYMAMRKKMMKKY